MGRLCGKSQLWEAVRREAVMLHLAVVDRVLLDCNPAFIFRWSFVSVSLFARVQRDYCPSANQAQMSAASSWRFRWESAPDPNANNADVSTVTPKTGRVMDGGDDVVAVTPTEKKPRASLHSEEKTKKARAFIDISDEPDCPDKKPDKKARTDDLNPLEKSLLKEYEMDEVGDSWTIVLF